MRSSKTLLKGVYHAPSLTTTANTILTFDGKGVEGHWLIHVDSFLAFGTNTRMILKDVTPGSTITWNALSYTTAGARGVNRYLFTYIVTDIDTKLTGIGSHCGGMFSLAGPLTLYVKY
jgi:hypothetical protein